MNQTWKQVKNHWRLMTFMILPLIYLIIFAYVPMLGLQIAFKDYDLSKGIWGSPWVGFKHFEKFLTSYQSKRVIKNTVILSFYSILAGFPMPIIFALLLNTQRHKHFKSFAENVAYIPHFISMVVLVGMIISIMNPVTGLVGNLYKIMTGSRMPDILASGSGFRHLYVWSGVWQNMGWNSIIYMAALANVDQELYEAAEIDGASRFQILRKIDYPSIRPTVTILLILSAGSIMTIGFEKIFLMQNPLNLKASEVISTYVYKVSLASGTGNFAYGTAVGLFNSIVNIIFLIFVNQMAKRISDTSLF